ncbi:MAG: hypothetical protein E7419_02935 [Ruminococcaceae bacterium]|nr:hypothetical protein [Oscillospiraceae bacterium]
MKNKPLIIFLFILFALPIPIAMSGSLMMLLWFIGSVITKLSFVEIFMSFLGMMIGATYIITYIYSLYKTWKNKKISFKTFFPVMHCLVAFLFLLSLYYTLCYIADFREYFEFSKRDFTVIEELDTHGGFHGDGSYYLILDCSDNKEEALKIVSNWNKLPLSENLNLIIYGGEKDGVTYGYKLQEEAHIPKIKNGYFMFEDRHYKSKDSKDDTELFDRYSFNFSIAIYDCDTDIMYYFEYDT